ncbi:MAG TPA: HPF/RaiA family ribosome-associated protein [Albitalea sp.]
MQVQLNTDDHVQGPDSLAAWVDSVLQDKLARFRDQVTRIEVHLSDSNKARVGDQDKRCTLEARVTGRQPVAVSHDAGNVADALGGAADKLLRTLDSTLGRLRDGQGRGRETIRGVAGEGTP